MSAENEEDRVKRDLLKLAEKFLFHSKTIDEKVVSLRTFAVTLYAGSEDASMFATKFLPHIMLLFEEEHVPRHLLLQILQSLSMVAYHNEDACSMILRQHKTMLKIMQCIEDVQHIAECRWACYLLCLMVHANRSLTVDTMQKYPSLKTSLQKVSDFPFHWDGWHGNLAQYLLSLEEGPFE